jgi:Ca-activated chloride channel homolog
MTQVAVPVGGNSVGTSGGQLVSTDGRALPLRSVQLHVTARAGVAQVTVRQCFHNPYPEALRVTYQLPLPADGSVGGFFFELDGERIVGVIDRKQRARERFEEALIEGRTAALLEQDRSSLFRQEVGNIPPHTTVVVEVVVDQPLVYLREGAWEWRFPTVVAPRYLGAGGRVADAARVSVPVADGPTAVHAHLALFIQDSMAQPQRPASPSHSLLVTTENQGVSVEFAQEQGCPLDRDVVVRWHVAQASPRVELDLARPHHGHIHRDRAFGMLTVVPPRDPQEDMLVPRDLVLLLDISGSMSGEPLAQVKRMVCALIDSLHDRDRLEILAFSWNVSRWNSQAVQATASEKMNATQWVQALQASGGTEMREGILAALQPLAGNAQRQVVLFSDGLIGFESEIVQAIYHHLPERSRVHTVGVGSSVNRSLTRPAARAGRGGEFILAPREDVEPAIRRLLAQTAQPVVVNVTVSGSALSESAARRLPDLYGTVPAKIPVCLHATGGELVIEGNQAGGKWIQRLQIPAVEAGEGAPVLIRLYARERIEELELQREVLGNIHKTDAKIEQVGLEFGIASRMTSWVAVSERVHVDPTLPGRSETQPHALPDGMSAEGLGLRSGKAKEKPKTEPVVVPVSTDRRKSVPEKVLVGRRNRVRPPEDEESKPKPSSGGFINYSKRIELPKEEESKSSAPEMPSARAPSPAPISRSASSSASGSGPNDSFMDPSPEAFEAKEGGSRADDGDDGVGPPTGYPPAAPMPPPMEPFPWGDDSDSRPEAVSEEKGGSGERRESLPFRLAEGVRGIAAKLFGKEDRPESAKDSSSSFEQMATELDTLEAEAEAPEMVMDEDDSSNLYDHESTKVEATREAKPIQASLAANLVRLVATIVLWKQQRCILQFKLEQPMEWDEVSTVTLVLRDGRRVQAQVDWGSCTQPGSWNAGMVLRLSLTGIEVAKESVTEVLVNPRLSLTIRA